MKAGFTGTQAGMTDKQKSGIELLLIEKGVKELHHGDCIGADSEAHEIATRLEIRVVIHPPSNLSKRAYCEGDEEKNPLPYLERNKNIVKNTNFMVATPNTNREILRSGTWATIRFAKNKTSKRIYIVWPDGTIE